jgi:hypothetical protein
MMPTKKKASSSGKAKKSGASKKLSSIPASSAPGVQFYAAKKPAEPLVKNAAATHISIPKPILTPEMGTQPDVVKPLQAWEEASANTMVVAKHVRVPLGETIADAIGNSPLITNLLKLTAATGVLAGMYVSGTWIADYFQRNKPQETVLVDTPDIDTFPECAAAGHYVSEGNPRICQMQDGTIYTETPISDAELERDDPIIYLMNPLEGATISNPLLIRFRARLFEDPIVIRIIDADGTELGMREIMVDIPAEGNYGEVYVSIPYNKPKELDGLIEIYEKLSDSKRGYEQKIGIHFR